MTLIPDRNQIEIFVDALLRHRGEEGYLSLRCFLHDNAPFMKQLWPARLVKNGFKFVVDAAYDLASRAANNPEPAVFCPPLAVFSAANSAREEDLLRGLVLSVDCDQHPEEARQQLQDILGEATGIVRSGGQWLDPDDGEVQDKLHQHWRISKKSLAIKGAATKLKQARALATAIVGGDPANVPPVHCLRWPGSWHRKRTPRLCSIVHVNPDVEIDLAEAVATLEKAAPETAQTIKKGRSTDEWCQLLASDVPEGQRNTTATSIAGLLLRRSVDPRVVLELLLPWNAVRCQPPLDPDEIIQIVNSITRRERQRRQ